MTPGAPGCLRMGLSDGDDDDDDDDDGDDDDDDDDDDDVPERALVYFLHQTLRSQPEPQIVTISHCPTTQIVTISHCPNASSPLPLLDPILQFCSLFVVFFSRIHPPPPSRSAG